jgi:Zn-dependent protease with chaperone function
MRLRILAWIGVMGMLGLGAWALGAWGGVAGTVLALTLLARATHAREERFLRELGPLVAAPPGLTRSFQRVLEESSIPVGQGPELWLRQESLSNAFWGRGPGTPGFIVLNQGLVEFLSESELRSVLGILLRRVQRRDSADRTLVAVLLLAWVRRLPATWVQLLLGARDVRPNQAQTLGPASFIGFLLGYPGLRLLLWLARESEPGVVDPDQDREARLASERLAAGLPAGSHQGMPQVVYSLLALVPARPLFPGMELVR